MEENFVTGFTLGINHLSFLVGYGLSWCSIVVVLFLVLGISSLCVNLYTTIQTKKKFTANSFVVVKKDDDTPKTT